MTRVSLGAQSFQPHLLDVSSARPRPTTSGAPCALFAMPDSTTSRSTSSTASPARAPPTSTPTSPSSCGSSRSTSPATSSRRSPGTRFTVAHGDELERQADAMEGYFEQVVDRLTAAGYRWYETANFCLDGERAEGRDLRALPQPRLLARAGLPRPRDRRGVDRRRRAAEEPAEPRRATSPRSQRASRRRARSSRSTTRRALASA